MGLNKYIKVHKKFNKIINDDNSIFSINFNEQIEKINKINTNKIRKKMSYIIEFKIKIIDYINSINDPNRAKKEKAKLKMK